MKRLIKKATPFTVCVDLPFNSGVKGYGQKKQETINAPNKYQAIQEYINLKSNILSPEEYRFIKAIPQG